jgi:hypothetical protein
LHLGFWLNVPTHDLFWFRSPGRSASGMLAWVYGPYIQGNQFGPSIEKA